MTSKPGLTEVAEKPRIQTAARTAQLLVEVARAGSKGISARGLGEALNVPRQVIYHLVHTLVSIGMLRPTTANSYILGLAVAPIAAGFRQQLTSSDFLLDLAKEAAQATGETAYVVGWLDSEIVILASVSGSAAITASTLPLGTVGDAHARASGKLLLAMSAPQEVESYFRTRTMPHRTVNTMTTLAQLKAQFPAIREDLIAYDREEYAIGLSCIAVPIGRAPSQLALGISAPTERFLARSAIYVDHLRRISASFAGS